MMHAVLKVRLPAGALCQLVAILGLLILLFDTKPAFAQQSPESRHVVLIGGLGGSPEHTLKFKEYLFETRRAFVEHFDVPESQVTVLAETSIVTEGFVNDVSNAENIRSQFAKLQSVVGESDHVIVIMFGHGSYDNGEARFNIPRRDLSQYDYASLVSSLSAGRIVFINTGSASAPFVEAISGPDRVVISATRTGTQKNETTFPRFMIEAFTSPAADRDKNGRLSVAEVYSFAAEKTDQWFADNANIPTENALIDDNGDNKGSRLGELVDGQDGYLAGITYLSGETAALASASDGSSSGWSKEKEQIEVEIAGLKSQKTELPVNEYYAQLEVLFIRLARGNAATESVNP